MRVPERVKGWLGAGLVVLVVRVMVVGGKGADGEYNHSVSGGVGVAEEECLVGVAALGFAAGEGVGAVGVGGGGGRRAPGA